MKFKSLMSVLLSLAFLATTTGCLGGAETAAGGLDLGSGNGATGEAAQSPLYIVVSTQYDSDTGSSDAPIVNQGTCNIDPDDLTSNDITCTVTIPEGRLYFSKLLLNVGTGNSSLCPRIEFYPYWRRLSSAAAYRPRGATADVDCTDATLKDCYDGAAVSIFDEFPKIGGHWFTTDIMSSHLSTVKSSWSLESKTGNLHTCNNLPTGSRGADVTEAGVQVYESTGGFQDYEAYCMDPYQGVLFRITMTISDKDTEPLDPSAPADDQFFDWN